MHFCPGSVGGAEWNGPAYDPTTNLILIGEVEWCTTVTLQGDEAIKAVKPASPGRGGDAQPVSTPMARRSLRRLGGLGLRRDADTGAWKWRLKSNYPVQSAVTPTAGGIAMFGDMGGNFYAVDASNGQLSGGARSAARSAAA